MKHNDEFVLEYRFNNVIDFYQNAALFDEKHGNLPIYRESLARDDKYFVGIPLSDIGKYKFHYNPGIKRIRELKDELPILGGKRKVTTWSYEDGKEMETEKLYEEQPYLKTTRKISGAKKGKFITIHINIAQLGDMDSDSMLWKAVCAAKIVDSLEKKGYRVRVLSIGNSADPGYYEEKWVDRIYTEVTVKRYSDPLNLSLVLTTISPWFFRYWTFLFRSSHLKVRSGMGRSERLNKEDSKENIYIDTGDCLSKKGYQYKLKQLREIGLEID